MVKYFFEFYYNFKEIRKTIYTPEFKVLIEIAWDKTLLDNELVYTNLLHLLNTCNSIFDAIVQSDRIIIFV